MGNNFFCPKPIIDILSKPKKSSKVSSQLIYGEKFKILSRGKNYIKVKSIYDRYTGYISPGKFKSGYKPTHKIVSLKSKIYFSKNDKFKSSKSYLPFLSEIEILKSTRHMVMFEKDRWVKKKEILSLNSKFNNYYKIFKLFLNCPYKWGGKTYKGIDCSALVQMYYKFNRKFFPRDTKDQIKVKRGLNFKKAYNKGNLIYWNGHVAICLSKKTLIHAYGPKKKVIIMPIKETVNIVKKTAKLEVKKFFSI